MKEGQAVVHIDPLCHLWMLAGTLPIHSRLTEPFSWSRPARMSTPWSSEVSIPVTDARVAVLRARLGVPPLSGLGVVRRTALSCPRHRGKLLEAPTWPPGRVRVSCPFPTGRRKETVGHLRSLFDRAAPITPYRFGAPGPWPAGPSGRAFMRVARVCC
jgi:hypothetical protein